MNTPMLATLLLALAALPLHAQEPSAPQPPPLTVAVLPFDGADDKLQAKGMEAATLLGAHLSTKAELWCVERAEIDKILSEHALKLSGLTDPSHAVQVGRLIGARVLVTGRVIPTGSGALLVAKVMSTETSRVFGETASAPNIEVLDKTAAELADKVSKLIVNQRATFQVEVEKPEARLARLRKLIEGRALPSVMVSIPEQHLRQSVPDPAAETEIKKTLLELGFEVVDAKQPAKQADVVIAGEAFSEAGARRNTLIAVRARVEAQAKRHSDGKVLAVDRETGVAVDIAESVAGKSALQSAAHTLVERLVAKITAP